jgi:hypothetical protein
VRPEQHAVGRGSAAHDEGLEDAHERAIVLIPRFTLVYRRQTWTIQRETQEGRASGLEQRDAIDDPVDRGVVHDPAEDRSTP